MPAELIDGNAIAREMRAELAPRIAELKQKGLVFNAPNNEQFRDKLRSAGFYAEWHKKFGDEAWAMLEKYTGKLA